MTLTQYITIGMLLIYGAAIVCMIRGLCRRTKISGSAICAVNAADLPGVSVIIPFRNEEHNLPPLLKSLSRQNYKGPIEVIFVNDGSADNGADIIKNHSDDNDRINIKIIDLDTCEIPDDTDGSKQLTTKQQALDIGVSNATHQLAAFTDADMILAPEWISSLVNTWLETDADLVFGHTSIIKNLKFLAAVESFQLEFLFAFAYAFAKLGLTGSCMGNNVLIVKDAYKKCGGQRGVGYSITEDRDLLKLMKKQGGKIAPAAPFHPTARTHPSLTAAQFINQMTRWAKGGMRPGSMLFAAGLLMLAQNGIFLLSVAEFLSKIIFPGYTDIIPIYPMTISAINFLLTWIFLSLSFKKHKSPVPALFYPAHLIFMMFEAVVFGWMMVFKPAVTWKGRKYNN